MSHCRRGGSTRSGNEKGISEHPFLRQDAEIYDGGGGGSGGRDTEGGSEKREKIYMHVAEAFKSSSRGHSLSDGGQKVGSESREAAHGETGQSGGGRGG